MFRSYFVCYDGSTALSLRCDFTDFVRAFDVYRNHGKARLYGVNRDDMSILLGERC